MRLVGHSSVAREAKCEGDEEPVKVWKEHNNECHLMHQKIDFIAAKLGIPFYPAGRGPTEYARSQVKGSRYKKTLGGECVGNQSGAVPQNATAVSASVVCPSLGDAPPDWV